MERAETSPFAANCSNCSSAASRRSVRVGLLHPGSVLARQGGGRKAVGLCGQRGGGEEGEYQKTDSAER